MKKIQTHLILSAILCAIVFSSCTKNQMVKKFGGTEEISLKPNEKLLSLTWRGTSLWALTEDTLTHIKHFRENSAWGVLEGGITIK